MRCLRILPAVWASTSWSLSSFTRNIALGSSSTTVPWNSSRSSLAICPSYLIRRRGSSRRPGSSPWLSPCQVSRSGFLHLPGERADHTEKRWQEQTPRQTALSRAKSPENCGSCRARHLMLRLQVEREALIQPPFELRSEKIGRAHV